MQSPPDTSVHVSVVQPNGSHLASELMSAVPQQVAWHTSPQLVAPSGTAHVPRPELWMYQARLIIGELQ